MAAYINIDKIAEYFRDIRGNIVLGIDGYIDEIWQALESRSDIHAYKAMQTIKQFGERIIACDEGGMAIEIISKRRGYGGFTGNTSRAVSSLGLKPTVIGTYGKGTINPRFAEMEASCNLISLGEPAVSHVFEFDNGKVMFPYVQAILEINWAALTDVIGEQELCSILGGADILGLGYWSSMPAFDEIVMNLCEKLEYKPKRLFFDFADVNKRDRYALEDTISLLGNLNSRIPMTLSLNEHEADSLFTCFGQSFPTDARAAEKSLSEMRGRIGLDELIVHTPYFAGISSFEEGTAMVRQVYCEKPVKTTGAGDTFNGGYIASSLGSLNAYERLAVGNAATSCFIQTGSCADRVRLIDEIKKQCRRT